MTVDMLNKDPTDTTTEADRANLQMFARMTLITFVFAMLVWLVGLCAHV